MAHSVKFFWEKPFFGETQFFFGRSHFFRGRGTIFWGRSNFVGRSHFWGEAIFWLETIFKKTLPLLPCNEWSKTFSESGSLKTHLTIIHLLVKNVPNNFLGRSHSPVLCSLFHKRKSVVPFKDSKNSNLVSTFSLLHHFGIVLFCPQICL